MYLPGCVFAAGLRRIKYTVTISAKYINCASQIPSPGYRIVRSCYTKCSLFYPFNALSRRCLRSFLYHPVPTKLFGFALPLAPTPRPQPNTPPAAVLSILFTRTDISRSTLSRSHSTQSTRYRWVYFSRGWKFLSHLDSHRGGCSPCIWFRREIIHRTLIHL